MAPEFNFYIGVDWGTKAHQICVMSADGTVVCEQSVQHSGAAMNVFFGTLNKLAQAEAGRVAVAIEVPH